MPGGQPTKYKKKYCKDIIKFFNVDPFDEVEVRTKTRNGDVVTYQKEGCEFPTLAGFASSIGVHRDTIHEWTKVHKEFSDSLKKAKQIQQNILMQNAIKGRYEKAFAIFCMKNIFHWSDNPKTDEEKEQEREYTFNIVKHPKCDE